MGDHGENELKAYRKRAQKLFKMVLIDYYFDRPEDIYKAVSCLV